MKRLIYPCLIFLISLSAIQGQNIGELIWNFQTGGIIFSSPSIGDDGSIYFGSQDNVLYALNPDGTQKWTFTNATDWIDSSPTLTDDGLVIVGSWDNSLYAVNRDTGELAWKFDTLNSIPSSPAVDEAGNLFFGSFDSYVYCLNSNGSQTWKTPVYGPVESNAIIGYDNVLYVADTAGYLYAIDKSTGNIKWFFRVEDVYTRTSISDQVGFVSTPAISQDGMLYIGCQNTYLYAIDTTLPSSIGSADRLSWSIYAEGAIDSSPIIAQNGDLIFAARDGYLYRVNNNGLIIWELYIGEVAYSSPSIDFEGNILIVGFDNPNGLNSSSLIVVDSEGTEIWNYEIFAYNDSSVTIAPDGSIYVGSNDFNLYKIKGRNRLGVSDWPMFLGNRTHKNLATNINDLDALDFFPQLSFYNGISTSNGNNEFLNTNNFPNVYSNRLGWLECKSIEESGNALLFSHKIGWLTPALNSTSIYYHFNRNEWLELIQDQSNGNGITVFTELSSGLEVTF